MNRANPRIPEADVASLFLDRWSPRSFADRPLTDAQFASLFEAARWAPSCYNDQPALFAIARSAEDRAAYLEALVETNRLWAARAPVLGFVLARRHFAQTGKPNRWAAFDAGAAWMSLALQARALGLYAHAMAGFKVDKAVAVTGIDPERFEVLAALAVGFRDEEAQLPDGPREKEAPNGRRPLAEVLFEGRFQDR
jgi:nitroreductase